MTNEELAASYKNAVTDQEKNAIALQLFEQNKSLIRIVIIRVLGSDRDIDDYLQESYILLLNVLDHYDVTHSKFATYYSIALKWHVLKLYTQERKRANRIVSLDDIIGNSVDGDEGLTYADIIPAPEDKINDLEAKILNEEIAEDLWSQVDELPDHQRSPIKGHYQCGKSFAEIAKEDHKTLQATYMNRDKGFRKLSQNEKVIECAKSLGIRTRAMRIARSGTLSFFYNYGRATESAAIMLAELDSRLKQLEK